VVSSPPPTYETVTTTDSNNVTNNYYYANGTYYEETTDPASVPTEEQWSAEQKAAAEAAGQVTAEQKENAVEFPEDKAFEGVEEGLLEDEYPEENFRIVAPPIGATVTMLPEDTQEKKVGEHSYFVYNNTWYKPFYSGDDVLYMVSINPEASPAGQAPAEAGSE